MMTSRKKKAYLTVIALGGVALGLDRFVLPAATPEPEPAAALAAATRAGPDRKVHDAGGSIPELPFPGPLAAYTVVPEFRDIFAPPGSQWPGRTGEAEPDNGAAAQQTAETFAQHHRLSGVLLQERLRIAVVDGRWVRIGEELDGCTLVELGENEARFQCRRGEASLRVIDSAVREPR